MNFGKNMLEKMMGMQMPDLSGVMEGYELTVGNQIKANVDYECSEGDLEIQNGVIILRLDNTKNKEFYSKNELITTLTLKIKPPNVAFIFFLTHPNFHSVGTNIIFPKENKRVGFNILPSAVSFHAILKNVLGYGYFIPYIPISTINFTNINATT